MARNGRDAATRQGTRGYLDAGKRAGAGTKAAAHAVVAHATAMQRRVDMLVCPVFFLFEFARPHGRMLVNLLILALVVTQACAFSLGALVTRSAPVLCLAPGARRSRGDLHLCAARLSGLQGREGGGGTWEGGERGGAVAREPPEIPTVDISAYFRDDPAGRAAAGEEVRRACEGLGMFYVVGHGLTPLEAERALESSRALFRLPDAQKIKLPSRTDNGFIRGFIGVGLTPLTLSHAPVRAL